MSEASVTNTRCTMCPLMSSPRMASAFSRASSGVEASFTPPALPRPPVFTWAFTTTAVPNSAADRRRVLGRLDGPARQHRDTVRGEQILRLVLVEVHSALLNCLETALSRRTVRRPAIRLLQRP